MLNPYPENKLSFPGWLRNKISPFDINSFPVFLSDIFQNLLKKQIYASSSSTAGITSFANKRVTGLLMDS
jgi:hypothetical protein